MNGSRFINIGSVNADGMPFARGRIDNEHRQVDVLEVPVGLIRREHSLHR